jgi:hypothetical protein
MAGTPLLSLPDASGENAAVTAEAGNSVLCLALRDAEAQLGAVRAEFHPASVGRGLPLHLTLLYPFLPRAACDTIVLDRIRKACAGQSALSFSLTGVGTFPGGFVYLEPEPSHAVRALMHALFDEFPELPPYGGEVAHPDPHATVGLSPTGRDDPQLIEAVRRRVAPLVPIRCAVDSISMFEEFEPGCWRLFEQVPLAPANAPAARSPRG